MNSQRLVLLISSAILAFIALTPRAVSQMTLGTVGSITPLTSCPNGRNFLPYATTTPPPPSMNCASAILTGCAGAVDLDFVYGVSTPSSPKGTIVFFAGDGGDMAADGPSQAQILVDYFTDGFQVVQIAWGATAKRDWEMTGSSNPASILAAACRPASFLNWVKNSGLVWTTGGMCAHGHSAGSAAIAYALAWYHAGDSVASDGHGYLDKVTLTSGPVFSDIRQGCESPNSQSTTVCLNSNQLGCHGWSSTQGPPLTSLEYTSGYKGEVNTWTGNPSPSCANNDSSTPTTSTENSNWFFQSILFNLSTLQPTFTYTNTALSAYLCETSTVQVTMSQHRGNYSTHNLQVQIRLLLTAWKLLSTARIQKMRSTGPSCLNQI
jgi:hypothetical protein